MDHVIYFVVGLAVVVTYFVTCWFVSKRFNVKYDDALSFPLICIFGLLFGSDGGRFHLSFHFRPRNGNRIRCNVADIADYLTQEAETLERAHPDSIDALDMALRLRLRAIRILMEDTL